MNISSKSLEVHQLCEVCFTVCQIKTTTEQRVMEFNQGRTKEDHRRKITLILHPLSWELEHIPAQNNFFFNMVTHFLLLPALLRLFPADFFAARR